MSLPSHRHSTVTAHPTSTLSTCLIQEEPTVLPLLLRLVLVTAIMAKKSEYE